ncbi:UNVERIFIED_CONTAM: hypothetical protein M9610_24330, partial [Salmonella sp. NW982]
VGEGVAVMFEEFWVWEGCWVSLNVQKLPINMKYLAVFVFALFVIASAHAGVIGLGHGALLAPTVAVASPAVIGVPAVGLGLGHGALLTGHGLLG